MLPLFSFRLASAVACASLALLAGHATAQVHRVVGPDGRVTYTDKPPAANTAPSAPAAASGGAPAGAGGLPYQLNQVAQRYPVTLYTGSACAPCGTGRNLLINRGVPFTEKTVNSDNDIGALQRLFGDTSLPALTIGGQRLTGFSDGEWTQYLDAAGYPKQSQLPPNYRRPAAAPLVAVPAQPAAPAADKASAAPARRPSAPPAAPTGPSPSNPAGIIF